MGSLYSVPLGSLDRLANPPATIPRYCLASNLGFNPLACIRGLISGVKNPALLGAGVLVRVILAGIVCGACGGGYMLRDIAPRILPTIAGRRLELSR